jgi:hypothetical protein
MIRESGETPRNAPGGFDAADPRQADIEQNQVWLKFVGLQDRLFPVRRLTHHVQDWIAGKKGTNGSPDHLVVIHDKNPNYGHFTPYGQTGTIRKKLIVTNSSSLLRYRKVCIRPTGNDGLGKQSGG